MFPVPMATATCWVMGQCYIRVLASCGAVPWLIPLLEGDEDTLRAVYERLDGLLLSWVDFSSGLRQWNDGVMPLLEKAGLRAPHRGGGPLT